MGLTGYYRKFVASYASLAAPLTELTKSKAPNKVIWTAHCNQAFKNLKRLLCSSPVLQCPDFSHPFILQTDASDWGVGGVLSQLDKEGHDHPVAYFSRKLLPIGKEILHGRKRVIRNQADHPSVQSVLVRQIIQHPHRPSCTRMARPVSRNRLSPNKFIPRIIYSGIDYPPRINYSGIVYHPLE